MWVSTNLHHYSAKAQKIALQTILLHRFLKQAQHNE